VPASPSPSAFRSVATCPPETSLIDGDAGPYLGHQLVLADDLAACAISTTRVSKCARRKGNRAAILLNSSLCDMQPKTDRSSRYRWQSAPASVSDCCVACGCPSGTSARQSTHDTPKCSAGATVTSRPICLEQRDFRKTLTDRPQAASPWSPGDRWKPVRPVLRSILKMPAQVEKTALARGR